MKTSTSSTDRSEQSESGHELGNRYSKVVSHASIIFALVIIGVFLDVVDFSIIQVALPTIRDQFAVSLADSQWLIGGYGITMAGLLMLGGRAGDIYGQKKFFIIGVVLFTLASLTGGFAPTFLFLVVSRSVQGIGAALSSVTALAIFIELFPEGEKRNKALGIFVAVVSAGFAAGAVAGGFLTDTFGWRSVMFVNVPIGAVAAILSQKYLANDRGRLPNGRLDLPGALSLTSGLMLLVYGLTVAGNEGISAPSAIMPIALSLLVLLGFLGIESRSKSPLMPLGFLRRGSVLSANILGLIIGTTMAGVVFIFTVYLQQVLGYSPAEAGLGTLPGALIFFVVGGWGASPLVNRFGVRKVLVSSTALAVLGSLLLTGISPGGSYYEVLPGFVLFALGGSIGMPTLNIAAFAGTKPGEEGLASGLISTSMRVGFPLGLALLLTVASIAGSGAVGAATSAASASVALVLGFRYALFASAILGVVGLVVALKMKEAPRWNDQKDVPHAPQEARDEQEPIAIDFR